MFRRPARSATPDGAFFILRSIHFLTALFNSIAAPHFTISLLLLAIRHFAIPPPFSSARCLCIANHCISVATPSIVVLRHSAAILYRSEPFHCVSLQLCTSPLLWCSPLCRCIAERFHSVAPRCNAIPLHIIAVPSLATAPRSPAFPLLSIS